MVKRIKKWNFSNKSDQNHNVYIGDFPEATTRRRNSHTKSFIYEGNPEHVILNVGTNELNSEKNVEFIANKNSC